MFAESGNLTKFCCLLWDFVNFLVVILECHPGSCCSRYPQRPILFPFKGIRWNYSLCFPFIFFPLLLCFPQQYQNIKILDFLYPFLRNIDFNNKTKCPYSMLYFFFFFHMWLSVLSEGKILYKKINSNKSPVCFLALHVFSATAHTFPSLMLWGIGMKIVF